MIDTTYVNTVRAVRCYVDRGDRVAGPAVRLLNDQQLLILSFDVLDLAYKPYEAYLVLCNSEWQAAEVPSTRFVKGVNLYPINDFSYQSQVALPYLRYRFELPQVLRAGNYVIVVHRLADPKDILLSARFMVYDGTVGIDASAVASLQRANYSRTHRIVTKIDQSRRPAANPNTDFIVHIRQNRNWLFTQKITHVNVRNRNELIYAPPFGGSDFCALPSFRRFDTRSFFNRNTGISLWERDEKGVYHAQLQVDRTRASSPHVPLKDINGSYFIESTDHSVAEYVKVHFKLSVDHPLADPVYVLGEFNQWKQQPEAKMRYDSLNKYYLSTLTLKQGYYEYLYWTENKGFEALEGCWSQSENEYEVLVYYKDRGRREEPLVGYLRFQGHI